MRLSGLLVLTAIVLPLSARIAAAQSVAPNGSRKPARPGAAAARPRAVPNAARPIRPRPSPSAAARPSSRAAARDSSLSGTLIDDPTGRIDKSGRPVGFYPRSRQTRSMTPQLTPNRPSATAHPPQNPQKTPRGGP